MEVGHEGTLSHGWRLGRSCSETHARARDVSSGEFFRHLALLAGLLTRFTAASLAVIMLGASTMVHQPHGFFMNWFGKEQGEGYEYHVLVIGIAAALLVIGAGRWSIDREVTARIAH